MIFNLGSNQVLKLKELVLLDFLLRLSYIVNKLTVLLIQVLLFQYFTVIWCFSVYRRKRDQLMMADGELVIPMGIATFPMYIGGRGLKCQMIVADIEVSSILGYDFLKDNHCEMNLGKSVLLFNGEQVSYYLQGQRPNNVFFVCFGGRECCDTRFNRNDYTYVRCGG